MDLDSAEGQLIQIGSGGTTVESMHCDNVNCVVVGSYTAAFDAGIGQVGPEPEPAAKAGFAIAYPIADASPLWVRWFHSTAGLPGNTVMHVTTTATEAYVAIRFCGVISVMPGSNVGATERTATAMAPAGDLAIVRLNKATGTATAIETTASGAGFLGRNPLAFANDRLQVVETAQFTGTDDFFGVQFPNHYNCGVASLAPTTLDGPAVRVVGGPMDQFCDAQASDGTSVLIGGSNSSTTMPMLIVDPAAPNVTLAAEPGAMFLANLDPDGMALNWSTSFLRPTTALFQFPHIATKQAAGSVVSFSAAAPGGMVSFPASDSISVDLADSTACPLPPNCSGVILRMNPVVVP